MADLDRLIDQDRGRWDYYLRRGYAHAAIGHWPEATADYSRALALVRDVDGAPVVAWSRLALLRLAFGDVSGYRELCASLLGRFGTAEVAHDADAAAWTCVLAPGAVADPGRCVQLAERAVAADPRNPIFLNTLGAALYRAGRFDEAIRRLDEAIQPSGQGGTAWDWVFLAMSHQHLGHPEVARHWLDKVEQWMDRKRAEESRGETSPVPFTWYQRWEIKILHQEATAVLDRGEDR